MSLHNEIVFEDEVCEHLAVVGWLDVEIEKAFGEPLSWRRLHTKRACRIRVRIEGGYKSPEADWPAIQEKLVNAMTRLEAALRPSLKALKLG